MDFSGSYFCVYKPSGIQGRSILRPLLLLFTPFAALEAQTVTDSNDSRVQELYTQAKAAEAPGDLGGAVASHETLLRTAPRLPPPYNNVGALYLRTKRPPKFSKKV